MTQFLITAIAVLAGLFLGWISFRILTNKKVKTAKELSQKIKDEALSESKVIKKEAALEAKEEWYARKSNLEKEIERRKKELHTLENKYNQRIGNIEERLAKVDRREQSVSDRERHINQRQNQLKSQEQRLQKLIDEQTNKLMEVAQMSKAKAIKQLLEQFEDEAKVDAAKIRKDIIDKAKSEAEKESLKVLAFAVQRTAVEYVAESCVSVVPLPSEEMKGRIIGREGRNIRAFENQTGIELIVDDTPEAVILSSFDPIRREIARRSLEKLITDGRIHPGRIEETIQKTQKEVDQIIIETGKQTCIDLGILDLPKPLENLIGQLQFRTSYGQNVLEHSIETAWICGMIAAEIGLEQALAKKVGLLHDIGKAVDHKVDGAHPKIGADLAKKYGLSQVIINAIEAHHEDVEAETLYAVLVQTADAISGSRPGARRETLESYLKRLENLEVIASSFEGVQKCFAIQAGREVRIMVEHNNIDDAQAEMLASDVAKKIENELQYPGQIKVTVIREVRKTALAK